MNGADVITCCTGDIHHRVVATTSHSQLSDSQLNGAGGWSSSECCTCDGGEKSCCFIYPKVTWGSGNIPLYGNTAGTSAPSKLPCLDSFMPLIQSCCWRKDQLSPTHTKKHTRTHKLMRTHILFQSIGSCVSRKGSLLNKVPPKCFKAAPILSQR